MTIVRKDTWTVYYLNTDTEETCDSKEIALDTARRYVGNNSYAKPFPHEDVYLFGPGDGTTSVQVRQDMEFATGNLVELRNVLYHAGYKSQLTETNVTIWRKETPTEYTEQVHLFREVPDQNAVVLDIHGKPWHHFVEPDRLRAFLVSLGIV